MKVLSTNLLHILLLIVLSTAMYQCAEDGNENSTIRVLHQIQDAANLEILLDQELILEAQPGMMSRSTQVPQSGAHIRQLTIRNSGNLDVLLREDVNLKSPRENVLVLEGSSQDIRLTPVTQKLDLNASKHTLEVVIVNLSDYELPAFSLIPDDVTTPIESTQILTASETSNVYIKKIPAADNVQFTVEVTEADMDVQYNTNTEVYEDLPANQASLIIITFEQSKNDQARFDLYWMRTSIL